MVEASRAWTSRSPPAVTAALAVPAISAVMVLAIQLSTAEPPKPTLAPDAGRDRAAGPPWWRSGRPIPAVSSGRAKVAWTTMSPAADSADPTAPADGVEHPVDREGHAGRHAAADGHGHVAGQRRNAGRVAGGDADVAVVAVIVDPSVTPAYTVFSDGVDRQRAAHGHAGAAGQADGDVVDAGAFLRAHLHGLRRHLRAAG